MIDLKKLRKSKGLTQAELGEMLGVSQRMISFYERAEKNLPLDVMIKLSKIFEMSVDSLINIDNFADISDTVRIPVVGTISAGTPIDSVENIFEYIDIPKQWTRNGQSFIGLYVRGDSMYPKYIDGDIAIVRLTTYCDDGKDCAVYVNNYEVTIKTVYKKDNEVILKPINPTYPITKYKKGEIQILGVVVEIRRRV